MMAWPKVYGKLAAMTMRRRWGQRAAVILGLLGVSWSCCARSLMEDCVDSLDRIFEAEQAVEDDTNGTRTYILCPNTTYYVAIALNGSGSPVEGEHPLTISRSNVLILCGEDGSSTNNCLLSGGREQLVFADVFETNQSVTNALVRGLTFTDALTRNVAVRNNGQLVLDDCVFKDNTNEQLILVGDRDVNVDASLTLSECVFSDNQIWPYSSLTVEGLVAVHSGAVKITNSIFLRNTLSQTENSKLEYMIGVYGGSLALDNTCFLDNDDRIAPVARSGGDLSSFSNSVQRNSSALPITSCEFISLGDLEPNGFNESAFQCTSADVPVCTATALSTVELTCFGDFSDIYDSEAEMDSDETTRTYRLCGSQEYLIRTSDAEDDDRENTTSPLIVGRSNVHVLCGADGKSNNGCRLRGGTYQLTIEDEYRVGKPFQNVLIQGLTFQEATTYNVATGSNNDVMLNDCIFSTEFERLVSNRRTTERVESDEELNSSLTVMNSLFMNNVVGISRVENAGLITNHKGNMKLLSNTFYETSVENIESEGAVSYVVANIEGNMVLNGNCFISNMDTIAPVLSYKGTISTFANGGSTSSVVANQESCEFVAVVITPDEAISTSTGTTPLSAEPEYKCIDFDVLDGCPAPAKADSGMPRGVPGNSTVVGNGPLSGSQSTSTSTPGSGNVALYCLVALAAAALVIAMVVVSYNVRRGASPLQLPSFRSDPIPPIL